MEGQAGLLEITFFAFLYRVITMASSSLYRPKDAVRAIKKRISGNKNFREVMLALTVSVTSRLGSPSSFNAPLTLQLLALSM